MQTDWEVYQRREAYLLEAQLRRTRARLAVAIVALAALYIIGRWL